MLVTLIHNLYFLFIGLLIFSQTEMSMMENEEQGATGRIPTPATAPNTLPRLQVHLKDTTDPVTFAKLMTLQVLREAEKSPLRFQIRHLEWLTSFNEQSLRDAIEKYKDCKKIAQMQLQSIRKDMLEKEKKIQPDRALANEQEVIEVDGFLYEDLDTAFDQCNIVAEGRCNNCKSTDVVHIDAQLGGPTMNTLIYLFGLFLHPYIEGKQVLIIGSGPGYHAYGAALFSMAQKVISCEVNPTYVNLQKSILQNINRRPVEVLETIIPTNSSDISNSSVIFLLGSSKSASSTDAANDDIISSLETNLKKDAILVVPSSFEKSFRDGWLQKLDIGKLVHCNEDLTLYYNVYQVRYDVDV